MPMEDLRVRHRLGLGNTPMRATRRVLVVFMCGVITGGVAAGVAVLLRGDRATWTLAGILAALAISVLVGTLLGFVARRG